MRRTLAIIVALAAGSVAAAPQLKPPPKAAADLTGTTWTGKSLEGLDQTVRFLADGKLTITRGGRTIDNATWTQDGAKVSWQVNERFSEYAGTLDGDTMDVSAHNKAGKMWTTSLTRVKEP
jgi:hypothetical protein